LGLAAAIDRHEDLHGSEAIRGKELATMLELLVHGLAYGDRSFQLAALIGEAAASPYTTSDDEFLDAQDYSSNQYSLMAGRVQFADRVAIGGSVGFYYRDQTTGRRWGTGWSYGVTVVSGRNIRVGLSYWSFPKHMSDYRAEPERMVHEAVNLGVSYQSPFGTLLAMDVRNLGEESRTPIRELHVGIEQKFLQWLALRGGYFQDRTDQRNIRNLWSAGIGVLDQNLWRALRGRMQEPDWALQYGVMLRKQTPQDVYYHTVTFLIRL
jgi:hypothetical protein